MTCSSRKTDLKTVNFTRRSSKKSVHSDFHNKTGKGIVLTALTLHLALAVLFYFEKIFISPTVNSMPAISKS